LTRWNFNGSEEPDGGTGEGPPITDFTDPRRWLTTSQGDPCFRHVDDESVWQWRGWSLLLLYKHYLEGKDITPVLRRIRNIGTTVVRFFGMSRYIDGGETEDVQFWPQHYGDAFYYQIKSFAGLLADHGLRFEFTVFADARMIMPDRQQQREHLRRIVAELQGVPNAFLEIENEWHVNQDTDLNDLQHQAWGDLLWASGDYDVERIDTPVSMSAELQKKARDARDFLNAKKTDFHSKTRMSAAVPLSVDPRPPMIVGRYVTYHGARSAMWPSEAGKEGHFYFEGWDTINHEGNRSYGQACDVPCVNDEPKGASDKESNRWGDERYTDWRQAEDAGAGFALSSAGGTCHTENGALGQPPNDIEAECGRAMFRAMAWYPLGLPRQPYEHDRTAGHILKDVPQLGEDQWAAGESVSRGLFACTAQIHGDYTPEPKDQYNLSERAGHQGGMVELTHK
jgi:hypothetical protein